MSLLWKALALALALLRLACSLSGLLRAVRRSLAALAMAITIAIAMTVPVLETPMIAPEGPVMPTTALLPVPRVVATVLTLRRLVLRERRLKTVVEPLFALVIAEFVADLTGLRPAHALPIAIGHVERLGQLLAIRHDDARIMLGVLQIVLCKHRVAGRLRISGERKILLRNMRRRAPNLHIRSIGFEAARQRIVVFPIVITTATAAILLSLPHCPSGSYVTSTCLINAHPTNAGMVLLTSGLGLADRNSTASDPSLATPSGRADPGALRRRSWRASHSFSRGNGPSVSLLGDQWC
jgi:hypothetical protein